MGIKEEIEKVAEAERQNLEDKDVNRRADDLRSKKKFTVLASLLQELSEALDPQFGEIEIGEVDASVFLGTKAERSRSYTSYISIKDNHGAKGFFVQISADLFSYTFSERSREFLDWDSNFRKYFPTEEGVMECLLKLIGKKVAELQHRNGNRADDDDVGGEKQ